MSSGASQEQAPDRAGRVAAIPVMLMATLGSQLVFPLYSRALRAGQDLRTVFARVHPLFAGFAELTLNF